MTATSEMTPNYTHFPAVNCIFTFQRCSYSHIYLTADTCALLIGANNL